MYTVCPDCQKVHALTLEQLRSDRGVMRCTNCSSLFDVLEFISESKPTGIAKGEKPPQPLPWEPVKTAGRAYWHAGLIAGLLLLAAQIVYFEGYAFSQNPAYRPNLEKICANLGCRLPVYKNLDDFNVLQGSFALQPDHNYAFHAVITNQAEYPQAYPTIKLTLLDYNEKPFAHRVFYPRDYLPAANGTAVIAPDATTEISLTIAAPATKVGGYTFKLI
ncbi:zinc-ribbon and DUF3426 domain-containing protein [Methylobacter sp. BlB1]|uniref:zinc-ribbon and DUF3426 domain-containing protein n=1 Tax=Methylobacter sp. BlB1 TaxID=2785914 RepID=UPI001894A345|nr:zinc-ribbon and DUF3426 domain-containing protein [Methylobacter sp. BlB1]MBF6648179.1 zinc-ribbon domain-containing protein [Methylobacter sp. BlB1]